MGQSNPAGGGTKGVTSSKDQPKRGIRSVPQVDIEPIMAFYDTAEQKFTEHAARGMKYFDESLERSRIEVKQAYAKANAEISPLAKSAYQALNRQMQMLGLEPPDPTSGLVDNMGGMLSTIRDPDKLLAVQKKMIAANKLEDTGARQVAKAEIDEALRGLRQEAIGQTPTINDALVDFLLNYTTDTSSVWNPASPLYHKDMGSATIKDLDATWARAAQHPDNVKVPTSLREYLNKSYPNGVGWTPMEKEFLDPNSNMTVDELLTKGGYDPTKESRFWEDKKYGSQFSTDPMGTREELQRKNEILAKSDKESEQFNQDLLDFMSQYDSAWSPEKLKAFTGEEVEAQLASTPGYKFASEQGQQAITRQAAAMGTLGSGRTGEGLIQYGQQLANNTFQSYMANLGSIVGMGLPAIGQLSTNYVNEGLQQANLSNIQGTAHLNTELTTGAQRANLDIQRASMWAHVAEFNANAQLIMQLASMGVSSQGAAVGLQSATQLQLQANAFGQQNAQGSGMLQGQTGGGQAGHTNYSPESQGGTGAY